MAITVGDQTYFCPFPRSFYGPESPCSQTDETITGTPQQPWVQPGGNFDGVKVVFYVGLALVVFWLSVRAMEAYAEIKQA